MSGIKSCHTWKPTDSLHVFALERLCGILCWRTTLLAESQAICRGGTKHHKLLVILQYCKLQIQLILRRSKLQDYLVGSEIRPLIRRIECRAFMLGVVDELTHGCGWPRIVLPAGQIVRRQRDRRDLEVHPCRSGPSPGFRVQKPKICRITLHRQIGGDRW